MLRAAHTVGMASGFVLAGAAVAQPAIQYTFGIRVLENQVADNGIGGALASLEVGTVGEFSLLASTDTSTFPSDTPGQIQFYEILDLSIAIGSISSGAQSGAYPSPTFFDALGIEDNVSAFSRVKDRVVALTKFASPDLGFSVFSLVREELAGAEPTLLTSTDLPLAIDASITTGVDFSIFSPFDSLGSRVIFDVFSVEANPVPAPSSAALLGLVGLSAIRRRR